MQNIELIFEVCFTAKSLGFNAYFGTGFYKQVRLPFLLVQGQTYHLRIDPMTPGFETEGYDYKVTESGIYESENGPVPFIKLEDIETFEDWLEGEGQIPESEIVSKYKEWKSYVKNEMENLSENFLKLGWHIAD